MGKIITLLELIIICTASIAAYALIKTIYQTLKNK